MSYYSKFRKLVATTAALAMFVSMTSYGFATSETTYSASNIDKPTNPFHIGIFNPPAPSDTNQSTYAEIAGMNVNFIVGGNSNHYYDVNHRALDLAEANGLQILVSDARFGWDEPTVEQNEGEESAEISQSQSWGQTFYSPNRGTDWGLNYISLDIDQSLWPANTNLTLTLYDSPAKAATIASASQVTPTSQTEEPTMFWLLTRVQMGTQYYMELTSDNPASTSLRLSDSNPYGDGDAYRNGVIEEGSDLVFKVLFSESAFKDGAQPPLSTLQQIVGDYGDHPALMGYNLYDEPSSTLLPQLGNMVRTLRDLDTDAMSLVNLWPSDADVSLTGMELNRDGSVLNSSTPLGQTFTTKAYENEIKTVQWALPYDQWGPGEAVTLTLYDSVSKGEQLAQVTLNHPTSQSLHQTFELNAAVQPHTSYYMELTHNGGHDNFFGVWRSEAGVEWYSGGQAYVGGNAIASDFWHAFNLDIEPFSYEDYVYRWVRADPDVMLYDYYPYYHDGTFSNEYYNNLEIVRRQSLAGNIDFWTYLQSVGIGTWLRVPSKDDLRHNIYTNLAYGAKGLIYFTYWHPVYDGFVDSIIDPNGNRNPSYNWAQELNTEVLALGDTLNRLESLAVYHTGVVPAAATSLPKSFFWQPANTEQPWIISHFKDESERNYVMVVNRDTDESQTGSFTLSTTPMQVTEVSKSSGLMVGANYNYATGVLHAGNFLPGEGKLFVIEDDPAHYAPLAADQTLNVLQNHAAIGMLQATDRENDALTYSIVTNGQKGTATIVNAATGAFSYTPDAAATGSDTFTFRVNDGNLDSNTATVTIHMTPELPISVAPGMAAGTTRISATVANGHTLAVSLETEIVPVPSVGGIVEKVMGEVTTSAAAIEVGGAVAGKYIAVYELDSLGRVVKFATAELLASDIKQSSGGSYVYVPVPSGLAEQDDSKEKGESEQSEQSVDGGHTNQNQTNPAKDGQSEFRDIGGHWAYQSIIKAQELGVVEGYADGSFKPDLQVTRAEFIVMLQRIWQSRGEEASGTFVDLEQAGSWARSALLKAVEAGWLTGYSDGTLRPNGSVSRLEVAVILARALNLEVESLERTNYADDDRIPAWGKGAVEAIRERGLLIGQMNNTFNPLSQLTRAEAVTLLVRLVNSTS